jgi:IS30 family transposase
MEKPKYKRINFYQRCEIRVMWKQGYSQKDIAKELGVSPSTICRELHRNITFVRTALGSWQYKVDYAQGYADDRQKNKPKHIKFTAEVEEFVQEKLLIKWSPEQISGYAKANNLFSISHERIYQFVLADKQSGGTLYKNLRQGHKKYRRRYGSGKCPSPIKNKVSIDDRPDIINNKERLGDWEIDTVVGKGKRRSIVTVAERISKKYVFRKTPNKKPNSVANATIKVLKPYKDFVYSITADNGFEFRSHEKISKKLGSEFYFAHPYSSWERGLNENSNGLLRQYLPKGADFAKITEKQLQAIEDEINGRPRKSLGYKTPNQVFDEMINKAA